MNGFVFRCMIVLLAFLCIIGTASESHFCTRQINRKYKSKNNYLLRVNEYSESHDEHLEDAHENNVEHSKKESTDNNGNSNNNNSTLLLPSILLLHLEFSKMLQISSFHTYSQKDES